MERAINLVDKNLSEPELFGLLVPKKKKGTLSWHEGSLLAETERQTIVEVIEAMEFNISKAASILGVSRATLYKKFKKYNVPIYRKNV